MIRILHSVSNMDRAGIETMLMNYYRHMDRSKVQFDFLCNKKKPGAYDEEIRQMGGKIFHTPGLNPLYFPKYIKYMDSLFLDNNDYRVIEAHNGALGVYALYTAKRNKIPVRILHAHGASITKDIKLPLKLFCKSQIKNNATHNFSCGVLAAKCYFGEKCVEKNEYKFVPNAIEVEKFLFDINKREEMRKKYNLNNRHVLGHVGRFMKQKNHNFLIDVFIKLKKEDEKACLVLLGDGELMENVRNKVKNFGLEDSVIFVGNVENVNEWYQAFDVFILPSIWEGLPVVGVEAQAADLPCIFSESITKEIALSSKVEFINLDDNISRWVRAIKSALKNNERKNNYDLITKHNYNISTEAEKLQNTYIELYGE